MFLTFSILSRSKNCCFDLRRFCDLLLHAIVASNLLSAIGTGVHAVLAGIDAEGNKTTSQPQPEKQECLSALCHAIFKVEELIFSIFTFLNEVGV